MHPRRHPGFKLSRVHLSHVIDFGVDATDGCSGRLPGTTLLPSHLQRFLHSDADRHLLHWVGQCRHGDHAETTSGRDMAANTWISVGVYFPVSLLLQCLPRG